MGGEQDLSASFIRHVCAFDGVMANGGRGRNGDETKYIMMKRNMKSANGLFLLSGLIKSTFPPTGELEILLRYPP